MTKFHVNTVTTIRPEEACVTAVHLSLLEAVSRGIITNDDLVKIEDRADALQNLLLNKKRLVRLPNGLYAEETE